MPLDTPLAPTKRTSRGPRSGSAPIASLAAELGRAFAPYAAIPAEQMRLLVDGARIRELAKGELLIRQGSSTDWLGVLATGLVRIYRVHEDVEVNLGFELAGGFVGDYAAYMQQAVATQTQQALEPSRVAIFRRDLLDRLLAGDACWRELARRTAEAELVRKLQLDAEARTMSAARRYETLVRGRSPLLRRVPLYHLASWLGVTPETLSRIRARRVARS